MSAPKSLPYISGLSAIAGNYRAILSDVWGVVHNGVHQHKAAVEALTRFRREHGPVVMITNAPRPWRDVQRILNEFGIGEDSYDAIITSGDLTSGMLAAHAGEKVYHLGPDRDVNMFDGIDVERTPLDQAGLVLCSGLFDDEQETPADYAAMLADMQARGLTMICANPDLVVERGNRLVYCAGSLAQAYEAIGGKVVYAGKPHLPVYQRALEEIARHAGAPVAAGDVLAIGDSIHTDLSGAGRAGIPALFIAGGIHGEEHPDGKGLYEAFATAGVKPAAIMQQLAWQA